VLLGDLTDAGADRDPDEVSVGDCDQVTEPDVISIEIATSD
jgi:hypothetical protein